MHALIVDDEPLARKALENFLAARSDIEHLDSASDAAEALEKVGKNSYDLLLLDINMPGMSGTELVDHLKQSQAWLPAVVFVTGHDEHAVAAFERHAVDYVLKPFAKERMAEALDRAIARTQSERAARLDAVLPHVRANSGPPDARIAIKMKGRVLFLNPADVIAVHAEGNYVLFEQAAASHLLRESISVVAEKLKPYGFIQIHRSVLVNTSCVEEIKPYLTGEYGLRIRGGKEYTVTRTYKKNLKALADSWIGGTTFLAG